MESPKRVVELFYSEIWNRGDHAAVERLCAETMTFRGSLGLLKRGRAEFADYMCGW